MIPLLRAIERSIATGQCVEVDLEGSNDDFEAFFHAMPSCNGGQLFADGSIEAWADDWFVRVIRHETSIIQGHYGKIQVD